jgi:uncharacterized protein (DUF488 family)
MSVVFTIGYEGISLDMFLGLLTANDIAVLADVRELPLSRKRGFSKTALRIALEKHGVHYRHFRELGAPKELRAALKKTGDWAKYREGYLTLLSQKTGVLEEVGLLLGGYRTCLLCFEEDPSTCHRSLVAEALMQTGWAREAVDLRRGVFVPAALAR